MSEIYGSLISFSSGDNRLDSMETGAALTRAMIRVMNSSKTKNKIHIINMSYGETAHHNNSGFVNYELTTDGLR